MQVYRVSLSGGSFLRPAADVPRVAVLGFFDGMHIGHAALFARARQACAQRGARMAVFSFEDGGIKTDALRLLSEEERLAGMAEAGAEEVFLYRFEELRDLSPAAFVEDILLAHMGVCEAVCGESFRFGAGGRGDPALLSALLSAHDGRLLVQPSVYYEGQTVSASAIRAALAEGDCARAAAMLGRPYAITGRVAHGRALGRTIGVPTANLPIEPGRVVPAFGVYAALGRVEGQDGLMRGVANVGVRPTVAEHAAPNCETHFFTPTGDIYGRTLTVHLLRRLRGEAHFENLEALRAQIARDAADAKECIATWLNGQN